MLYGECLALTTALLWGTISVLVRKGLPYANASVAVCLGLLAGVPLLFRHGHGLDRPRRDLAAQQAG